jgi:hypothetical protein
MKRLLITVLAIFYLSVSSGATVHFHYCMGELIEWGLSDNNSAKENDCSNCGMKKGLSEDCCKDQKQEFKLKESQKAPISTLQPVVFAIAPITFSELPKIISGTPVNLISESNAPPRTLKTAVFVRNCNFRI